MQTHSRILNPNQTLRVTDNVNFNGVIVPGRYTRVDSSGIISWSKTITAFSGISVDPYSDTSGTHRLFLDDLMLGIFTLYGVKTFDKTVTLVNGATTVSGDYSAFLLGGVRTLGWASKEIASAITYAGLSTTSDVSLTNLRDSIFSSSKISSLAITNSAVTTAKINDSSVTTVKINDSSVTTDKISDSAITNAKFGDSSVSGSNISAGGIAATNILDGNITTIKIALGAVTSDKILNSNITNAKLDNKVITSAKFRDQIFASKLNDKSVTGVKLTTNAIDTTSTLSSSLVQEVHFSAGSVTSSKLVSSNIGYSKLADASITLSKIANLAINSLAIANGTLVTGDIADLSVISSRYAFYTITTGKIGDLTIEGRNIAAGAITEDQLGSSSIISSKIAASTLVNEDFSLRQINTAKLGGGITGSKFGPGSIATGNISDLGIIGGASIGNYTLSLTDFASSSITGAAMVDSTITSAKIGSDLYTALKSPCFNEGSFAPKSVTTAKLSSTLPIANEKFSSGIANTRTLYTKTYKDKFSFESAQTQVFNTGISGTGYILEDIRIMKIVSSVYSRALLGSDVTYSISANGSNSYNLTLTVYGAIGLFVLIRYRSRANTNQVIQ